MDTPADGNHSRKMTPNDSTSVSNRAEPKRTGDVPTGHDGLRRRSVGLGGRAWHINSVAKWSAIMNRPIRLSTLTLVEGVGDLADGWIMPGGSSTLSYATHTYDDRN